MTETEAPKRTARQTIALILRILLGLAFVGAGINHFVSPEFYIKIMPDYIPYHRAMVLLSGATEIVAGVMVVIPRTMRWGAWFIVAHLVVFLTVHVWMLQHPERYKDVPLWALWMRLVLQIPFIGWAAWYARAPKEEGG